VLKELIEKGFIESRTGTSDRRQRLLYTTARGHELAVRLAKLQTRRIMRALADMDSQAKAATSRFLLSMIDANDRAHVQRLVFGAGDRR
jgi:DNA-binding MarR family transcriptional regulator